MKASTVAIWLVAFSLSIAAFGEEGSPPSSQSARRPIPETIEQVIADWVTRRTRLSAGRFTWRIDRHHRSPDMGNLRARNPNGKSASGNEDFETVFRGNRFYLQGESTPHVRLGGVTWRPDSSSEAKSAQEQQFLSELNSRFARERRGNRPQPYQSSLNDRQSIHYWAGAGEEYPRAVVFTGRTAELSYLANTTASRSLPVVSGVLAAFRLAVRPQLVSVNEERLSDVRLLARHPVVDGRECVVLEEPFSGHWGAGTRRLWIDPSSDNRVVRCVIFADKQDPRLQYDASYSQNEDGLWLPQILSVIELDSQGDVYDHVIASRTAVDVAYRGAPPEIELSNAAGTWVTDHAAGAQYVIRGDGSRREITGGELAAGIGYAELMSADPSRYGMGRSQRRLRETLLQLAITCLTWPGILVTLPVLLIVVSAARAVVRRTRRRKRLQSAQASVVNDSATSG